MVTTKEDRREYYRKWRKNNSTKGSKYYQNYKSKDPERLRSMNNAVWARYKINKPIMVMLNSIRGRCRKKGLLFDLSYSSLEEIIYPMLCSVTGVKLSWDWEGPGYNPWAPSIDRLDNDQGYIKGNIRLVCWAYNLARGRWSDEVVQKWARNIQ